MDYLSTTKILGDLYVTGISNLKDTSFSGNLSINDGYSLTTPTLYINDTNTKLTQKDADGQLRITTPTGYVDIGSTNTSWTNFNTDRAGFYFDKTLQSAGDSLISGHGRFNGSFTESTTIAGAYIGYISSPRIMFSNGNASQNWQIDNTGGNFRWFLPSDLRMTLNTSGLSLDNSTNGVLHAKGSADSYFTGSLGIGTTDPSTTLHVDGTLRVDLGDTYTISDVPSGTMMFGNASGASNVPTMVSRSDNNIGFNFETRTLDTKTSIPDLMFNIRENDNTDFTTKTGGGFAFRRYATDLMTLDRAGNLTVAGGITYSGDITQLTSNEVNYGDNIIRLNTDWPDNTVPTENSGIEVYRGTGTGSEAAVQFIWDETNDIWSTPLQGLNTNELGVGINNPSQKFHVYDGEALIERPTANSELTIQNNSGSLELGVVYSTNQYFTGTLGGESVVRASTGDKLHLGVQSSAIAVTVSTDNVGINNTTPTRDLDVQGNIGVQSWTIEEDATSGSLKFIYG
jgi:hypothetical protein